MEENRTNGKGNGPLPVHELATIFPDMTPDEFSALKADIAEHGMHQPVAVWRGSIIDGRNRHLAAQELGIETPLRFLDDDVNPVDFVLSANLSRRNLDEGQRAMVMAALPKLTPGVDQRSLNTSIEVFKPMSRAARALRASVSEATQERADAIYDFGDTELINKVRQGKVDGERKASVSDTYNAIQKTKQAQKDQENAEKEQAEAEAENEKAQAEQEAAERAEREAAAKARAEQEAAEKARAEQEAAERAEQEAAARAKAEQEAAERARAEQEAAERTAAEARESAERAAREATEAREAAEKARTEQESAEKAKAEQEAAEKARAEQEAAEKALKEARESAEKARAEQEATEKARAEQEAAEKARAQREAAERASEEARESAEKARAEQEAAERALEEARESAERAARESEEKTKAEQEATEKAVEEADVLDAAKHLRAENLSMTMTEAIETVKNERRRAKWEKEQKEQGDQEGQEDRQNTPDLDPVRLVLSPCAYLHRHVGPETVDLILTDPPYKPATLSCYRDLAEFAVHALRPGGALLAMASTSHLPQIMEYLCNTGGLTYHWTLNYLMPGGNLRFNARAVRIGWKPVIWLVKGQPDGVDRFDVINMVAAPAVAAPAVAAPRVANSEVTAHHVQRHKWGQNEAGFLKLLELFVLPGQVVCDPFLGSGATALVARQMGCGFIGADVENRSIEVTRDRLLEV